MQKTYSLKQPIISLGLFAVFTFLLAFKSFAGGYTLVDTLEISVSSAPTGCINGTDGLITVNINGGTIPYNVEFSPEIKRRTVYNSITVPGFVPGTYTITVTDQLGEQESAVVTVDQGTAPPVPDSLFIIQDQGGCLAECQGWVELDLQEGYIFRWNGRPFPSDTFPRLCAGDHVLTIERIEQSCIVNLPVNLPEPPLEEALPQCPGDTIIAIPANECAAVFDYGLQDWASEACGVGKNFLASTDMVDDGYGLAGTMFDLENVGSDTLYITGYDLLLDEGTWDIQAYQTRIAPTFVGNTFNGTNGVTNINWRFFGQTTVSSSGPAQPTHVPLGGIILAPGASTGVYITSTRDWLNGPISMQVTTPSAEVSNCDLKLKAGIGLTNRAGLGFAQAPEDLIFGNTNQSGGANNTNYRLIEANIYYVPLNKGIYQVDGTGLSSLSSFPVGTTTQALSFVNNGNVEDAVCVFTVHVAESTPPTFTSCPEDITVEGMGAGCAALVEYLMPTVTDNCLVRELGLTLNQSAAITGRALCQIQGSSDSPQSSHIRVFDLQANNLVSPFQISEVEVGISESNGTESATVNVYEIHPDSSLVYANMNLLQSQSFTPPAGTDFVHPVPVVATVPQDRNLVVELIDPDNSVFVAGYTQEGNGVSYFVGCGYPEPTNLLDINCVKRHFYAKVTGSTSLPLTLEQTDGTGLTSGSLFPGGTNLQEFTATDASGNTSVCSFNVHVISDLAVTLTPTGTSCATNDGTITTEPEGGVAPYTFSWSNGSTEQNLTGLAPGSYSVTVSDQNGCTINAETIVEGDLAPVITLLESQPSYCGNNNGSALVEAEGSNGPFSFEWSSGATDPIAFNLGPGIYSVTVTDTLGCATSSNVEVAEIPGPDVVSLTSLPTYCGHDNGSAAVVPGGDNGPFFIEWSTGSTDSLIQNLGPGIYTVTITDSNACQTAESVEVEEIFGPNLDIYVVSPSLCGGSDGSAAIVPIGSGPFLYAWENGVTDSLITGITAGEYLVEVTDSFGCVTAQTIPVNDLPGPELTFSGTLPSGCIIPDGTATVTPLGEAPFTFEWSTGATDSTATGLLPGLYEVTVMDGNNCVSIGAGLVETPAGPDLEVVVTPPTNCNADDATATVQADGIWPFSFSWSNGSADSIAVGLVAGTYTVEVTDAVGCISSAAATVDPVTDLAITGTEATPAYCGESDGTATVSVEGGDWPYSFEWSNGAVDSTLFGLSPGVYSVTVTDAFGCISEGEATVEDAASPVIDGLSAINAYCGQANGSAEAFISGGTGNYVVEWSNGGNFPAITDLVPGEYSITVSDENNCAVTGSVVVGDDPGQNVFIQVLQQPSGCLTEDGVLGLEIDGGVFPYSVTWSNGSSELIQINIPAGEYSVVVTDDAGCEVAASTELVSVTAIIADWSTDPATCGNSNGTVEASFTGGVGPIQYVWSFNGEVLESDTADIPFLLFTGLEEGLYELQLFDTTGCLETAGIEVPQEASPVIIPGNTPATCGQENGSAWVEISGGAYPFTFVWDNGSTDSLQVNLPPGEYAIAVLDDNDCISTGTVIVEDAVAPVVNAGEIVPATCDLDNGQILLDIQSSTPEYTIAWSNGDSTFLIENLPAGEYSVVVTDANGCETSLAGLIVEQQPDTEAPVFVVCPSDMEIHSCDSVIVYDLPEATDNCVLEGVEQMEGLPSGAAFPTGPTAISYLAGDLVGNTSLCEFTITRLEDLAVEGAVTPVSCFGGEDGVITLAIAGGAPPYAISWASGDTSEILTGLSFGLYSVTVSDQGNCTTEATILLEEPALISIALDSIVAETKPCENGAVYITTLGGTAPYTFEWANLDDPEFEADTEDLENLVGGTYQCVVTDANGCKQTGPAYEVPECSVATREESFGSAVELYPNPTKGLVMVLLNGTETDNCRFTLYDSRGVQMTEFSAQRMAEKEYQLDLSGFPNGMYWIRIQAGTDFTTRRVVLSK